MRRIKQSIGGRIAKYRRDKGLTQIELAKALNVSQPVVSDYENDVIKVSSETLVVLARVFGVSADDILGLDATVRASHRAVRNHRVYRQLQSIDRLPKRDQEALARTIDAFLAKGQ